MTGVLRLLSSVSMVLLICNSNGVAADSLFYSPKSRFSVQFKVISHEKFTPEQERSDLDHYSNIKYRVCFTDTRSKNVRSVDYVDVYSSSNRRTPTLLSRLFAQIIWSPSDDFAILPEEDWPGYPVTASHTALNLNPGFNWSSAELTMTEFVWIDSVSVSGNYYGECSCSVYCFNGRTGKTITVKQAISPIGYAVVGVKGQNLVIKSILDNCASGEDRKRFKREDILIKLSDFTKDYLTQAP